MAGFIIRSQQEARLREGARSAFLGRVEEHVKNTHPAWADNLNSAQLRQFVEKHWESARIFGLVSERALCDYLTAVCKLGDEFPKESEASALLRSADFEGKKLSRLRDYVERSLAQRAAATA